MLKISEAYTRHEICELCHRAHGAHVSILIYLSERKKGVYPWVRVNVINRAMTFNGEIPELPRY